jgi:enediyne biosynthesis protein E4
VFRNDLAAKDRRWLKMRLVGDPAKGSTRDAIGARIQVDSANHRGLLREVASTIGYLSVHPKQQHFGLGSDDTATVAIVWPNGDIQRFANLAANQAYTLRQGGAIESAGPSAKSAARR